MKREIDIERFVHWALVEEKAPIPETAQLASMIVIKGRQERAGGGACGGSLDANTCALAIARLPNAVRSLIIAAGKSNCPPEWYPKGQELRRYKPKEAKRATMILMPELEYIEAKRAAYVAWWDGLKALADYFKRHKATLARHAITGPAIARNPWSP